MLKKIRDAEAWLDTLDADPVKLRTQRGMKGKKHFVELLLAYQNIVEFYRRLPDGVSDADRVSRHAVKLLEIVNFGSYHDLSGADDKRFKEDVLSYLYACQLAGWFGCDARLYLSEIKKILPRVYLHASTRGASQRMALIRRLAAIGLSATDAMEQLVGMTYIRQRKPLAQLLKLDVYTMVHEVFHLTNAGQHVPELLNEADMDYLKSLFGELFDPMIEDIDLLAEVVEASFCLGEEVTDAQWKAVDFIAAHQNGNGSFGSFEDARKNLQQQGSIYDVDVGMYLHTTAVCLRTLVRSALIRQAC